VKCVKKTLEVRNWMIAAIIRMYRIERLGWAAKKKKNDLENLRGECWWKAEVRGKNRM